MAVDNGLAAARGTLGWLYLNGMGTQKDEKKGFELMELAAKGGDPNDLYRLATCYALGRGTKSDPMLAMQYLQQASGAGPAEAINTVSPLGEDTG
jgi:TPR repeat protein